MPDTDRPDASQTEEAESSSSHDQGGGLWKTIRSLFDNGADTSLRAQLEEAIDEHEDEAASNGNKRDHVPDSGDLSVVEVTMLKNLLHFNDHDADDVAIPRSEIIAVRSDASWKELIELFAEHGHSRLPVYRDQLDEVIGMMHIKDIFPFLALNTPPPADWTVLMRQPLYVPQSRRALDVLADMRSRRTHLAIVLDEFSGTDGIITIEDLVEEIVGEIEDEHDELPVDPLIQVADGVWDAEARIEIDDLAKRVGDPRLAEIEEAVDTLGGVAFVLAGEVPRAGRVLEHPSGWTIEVLDGDETHVTRLRLHRPAGESKAETD